MKWFYTLPWGMQCWWLLATDLQTRLMMAGAQLTACKLYLLMVNQQVSISARLEGLQLIQGYTLCTI